VKYIYFSQEHSARWSYSRFTVRLCRLWRCLLPRW